MTFHCLGALDTIRLISVDLRISVYHVLHVLFGLPLSPALRCASVTFQIGCYAAVTLAENKLTYSYVLPRKRKCIITLTKKEMGNSTGLSSYNSTEI